MTSRKLVRVQEKGQITIPTEVRRKLGLGKGDLVSVEETTNGVLITPQKVLALQALDRIGEILREKGLTFEDLMESGAEVREELVREQYGQLEKKT
jgi:AbrB family looped-hinge helix DNA binding protein